MMKKITALFMVAIMLISANLLSLADALSDGTGDDERIAAEEAEESGGEQDDMEEEAETVLPGEEPEVPGQSEEMPEKQPAAVPLQNDLPESDQKDSKVTGTIWLDKNSNGIQDADEEGLNGIKLVLEQQTESGWEQLFQSAEDLREIMTTTKSGETEGEGSETGHFTITGLAAGIYRLGIVLQGTNSFMYQVGSRQQENMFYGTDEGSSDSEHKTAEFQLDGKQSVTVKGGLVETPRTTIAIDLDNLTQQNGYTLNGKTLDFDDSANQYEYRLFQSTTYNASGTDAILNFKSGVNTKIVMDDIRLTHASGSNFNVQSGAAVVLWLEEDSDNYLTCTGTAAGLSVPSGANLTIEGKGKLMAQGNGTGGAGIGGSNQTVGGTITINGGMIEAKSAVSGAGIGGGNNAVGGNLTINGGVVNTQAASGPGIGGVKGGSVTIHGGTVTSKSTGTAGAGIGGAWNTFWNGGGTNPGNGGNITIDGGVVTATGTGYGAGIGGSVMSSGGTIRIEGTARVTARGGSTGAGIGGGCSGAAGSIYIGGEAIVHASNASGTTKGAAGIGCGGAANSGGSYAGGTIRLDGGYVTAVGGAESAGIGGGGSKGVDLIEITSKCTIQSVTAGKCGAAIGGGYRSSATQINITGQNLNNNLKTLTSDKTGAIIGSGNTSGAAGNITMVNCTFNNSNSPTSGGAAIGGGYASNAATNIDIVDSRITAYGYNGAAGIGGGDNGAVSSIRIDSSTIEAYGSATSASGVGAAGIGSANGKAGGNIRIINGSKVTAYGARGGGHGIGSGGTAAAGAVIAIDDTCNVEAYSANQTGPIEENPANSGTAHVVNAYFASVFTADMIIRIYPYRMTSQPEAKSIILPTGYRGYAYTMDADIPDQSHRLYDQNGGLTGIIVRSDADPQDLRRDQISLAEAPFAKQRVELGQCIITGTLWQDTNKDGLNNDGASAVLANREVRLLEEEGGEFIYKGKSTVTNGSGVYRFVVDSGEYKIQFPIIGTYGQTLRDELQERSVANDADNSGQSRVIEIELPHDAVTVTEVAHGGYAQPYTGTLYTEKHIISPAPAENATDLLLTSLETNDVSQKVEYQLQFTLPTRAEEEQALGTSLQKSLIGYRGLILQDILPEHMTLSGAVKVWLEGDDGSILEYDRQELTVVPYQGDDVPEFEHGTLISYAVTGIDDYELLAGRTLCMSLEAELEDCTQNGYEETYTNYGRILVNHYQEVIPGEPEEEDQIVVHELIRETDKAGRRAEARLQILGEISGRVFADLDRSGNYSNKDQLLGQIDVYLYDKEELEQNPDAAYLMREVTNDQGAYSFSVPMNKEYVVAFPPSEAGMLLITPDNSNDAVRSHADPVTGCTSSIAIGNKTSASRLKLANAGYIGPDVSSINFDKQVRTADGEYGGALNITNPETILHYQLQFRLPPNMDGYESIEIQDHMPKTLELVSDSGTDRKKVQAGNTDVLGSWKAPVESGDVIIHSFVINDRAELQRLRGQLITMELEVRLANPYPSGISTFTNKGKLLINDIDRSGEGGGGGTGPGTGISLKGRISGTVKDYVIDGDGLSGGTALKGAPVQLYKRVGAGETKSDYQLVTEADGGYTSTDKNGAYELYVEREADYRVVFPTLWSGAGLIRKSSAAPASHADPADGWTDKITIGEFDHLEKTADAGYVRPDIEGGMDFHKQLIDEDGEPVTNLVIADLEQPLIYEMAFQIPGNAEGIYHVQVEDHLPVSADQPVLLPFDETDYIRSIEVKAGNATLDLEAADDINQDTDKDGIVVYDRTANILKLVFRQGYDFKILQNQLVTVTVTTRVNRDLKNLPDSITNKGKMIINRDTEGSETGGEGPEIKIKGMVKGTIFEDRDGDGLYNNQDAVIPEAKVILYQWDGQKWDQADTIDTTDGTYSFEVELEAEGSRYQVGFEAVSGGRGLTLRQPDTEAKGSHAEVISGRTDTFTMSTSRVQQSYVRNAGYFLPDTTAEVLTPKKLVQNPEGSYQKELEWTDPEGFLRFAVSFQLPGTMKGISRLEIQDILPEELEPGSNNPADNIAAYIGTGTARRRLTADEGEAAYKTGTGALAGKQIMSWRFAPDYPVGTLINETVTVEITTRLKAGITDYDLTFGNNARLLINGKDQTEEDEDDEEDEGIPKEITEEPNIKIIGVIQGTVYYDRNQNQDIDGGEELEHQRVELYRDDSMVDWAETGADGWYQFKIDFADAGDYEVKFKRTTEVAGATIGLMERGKGSAPYMNTGYTDQVTVDSSSGQSHTLNAGYCQADVSEVEFTKQVKDGDEYTNQMIITELGQMIEYELSFYMAKDMSGFYSIRVEDLLPDCLELYTGIVSQDVALWLGDDNITAQAGVLDYLEAKNTITFDFYGDYNLTQLADRTVAMRLKTKLKASYYENPPEEIINSGRFIVNDDEEGGEELPDEEKPIIQPGKIIKGYLWHDGNENGLRDGDEEPAAEEKVTIIRVEDGLVVTACTDEYGYYEKKVPYGTYRIQFPKLSDQVFTLKHAEEGKAPEDESDANYDGSSDPFAVTKEGTDYIKNAGYTELSIPEPDQFTKLLVDEEGNETELLTLPGPEGMIHYVIRLKLGILAGYESMEITDQLDSRLELQEGGLFLEDGTDITETAGTLSVTDGRVSYLFAEPLDVSLLARQTVELRLTVSLKEGITDLSDIRNTADLNINETDAVETETDPKVVLEYGYIEGYVFIDENGNRQRDGQDTMVRNAQIILQQQEDGQWISQDEVLTDDDGYYCFISQDNQRKYYPYGSYRVIIKHNIEKLSFLIKPAETAGLDGIVSDVDAEGIAGFVLDEQQKTPKPSAGLQVVAGNGEGSEGVDSIEQTFRKMPKNEHVKPGALVDFEINGFGNQMGRTLKRYSISDIFPEGLHFEAGVIPAFTKGAGLVYDITYITNRHPRRVLYSDQPADREFTFKKPQLEDGEYITHLTLRMDEVPDGFGIGDTIIYTCRVSDNPGNATIVNEALLGFDGRNIFARTNFLNVTGSPKTGDMMGFAAYTVLPVLAALTVVVLGRKRRRRG